MKKYYYDGKYYTAKQLIVLADTMGEYDRQDNDEEPITSIKQAIKYLKA